MTYSANVGTGSFSTTGTAYNPSSTTLSAAIDSTAATIPVASVAGYAPFGRVTIDSERINYAKTSTVAANCAPASAPCFTGARRGVASTTPAAHSAGAALAQGLCLVQSIGSVSATGAQRRVQAATEGGSAPIGIVDTPTTGAATLSTATSMTWTITVGASGANRLLIVGLSFERGNVSGVGVTSTSGGGPPQALTQIIGSGSVGGNPRAELWYLVNPGTGLNTIQVLWSGSTSRAFGGAASFTGVDQTTPIGVSGGTTGKSTDPSVSITTVTNNAWVIGTLAWDSEGATATMVPATNRVSMWNNRTGSTAGHVGGAGSRLGPVAAPGNVTMNWTLNTNNKWAMVAASLRPAGAGGAVSVWQERF